MSFKANSSYPDSIPFADTPYSSNHYRHGLQNNIPMATNSEQQQQQQQQQQQWRDQAISDSPGFRERTNSKKALNQYIFDFLSKSSLKNTAAAFAQDAQLNRDTNDEQLGRNNYKDKTPGQSPMLEVVDAPQGFLFEWWQIFWDIFNTSSSRGGSESAQQYYQLVLQEQRQEQIYRSLAVHAARLQHDAERRGEYINEEVDPMHLAAMMLGNSMSPAASMQNVNVNPMPIPMVGNPIVNSFPIPPYSNTNLATGATTVTAAAPPSSDFSNTASIQNRNQNVTGWPVYNYPMQPSTENSAGIPCNNNTTNTTSNNKSPVNLPKNLKNMHSSSTDKPINVAMPKSTRSRSATSKAKGKTTNGTGTRKRRKITATAVSAGSANAASPNITTPGSTTSEPAMVNSRLNKTPKSDTAATHRNQVMVFGDEDAYSNKKVSPLMSAVSPSTIVAKQPAKARKNTKKASTSAFSVESTQSTNKSNSNNGISGKKRSPPNSRASRRKSTPSVTLNDNTAKDANDMFRTRSNNTTPNIHSAPPSRSTNPLPFSNVNLGSFNKPAVSSPLSSVTESCFDPDNGKIVTKGGPKRAVNSKVSASSPLNISTSPSGDAQKQRNSKPTGSAVIKPPQGFSTTNLNITLKSSIIIPSQNNIIPQELPTANSLEAQMAKDLRSNKGSHNAFTPEGTKTPNNTNQVCEFENVKNPNSLMLPNQIFTSTNGTPNENSNLVNTTSSNKGNSDSASVQPASNIGTTLGPHQASTTEHQNSQPQEMKLGNIGIGEGQGTDFGLNLLDTNENDFNFINWEG
ncbi:hypothetical protein SEUBUCD646_0E01960 [Saccharomyces eubayanus]|uniref:FLO8-like protein n=1 Tax=Saccharomyces eubayanus TaxID=1080349 RepID=A0ABN8VU02_SACEU|nr:hypothetical protein SEUBUCD650_0E02000 [Saccharomyces eubayanus]CAI1987202.1 hypothetical protein SEUBUCD646_0E01960 [Saccharomyces eubayanus]